MNKIHIYNEDGKQYFIEQETNEFYTAMEATSADKGKIAIYSSLSVFFASIARGLCNILDSYYIPIANIASNLFLIFLLIMLSIYIFLKWLKKYKLFKNEQKSNLINLEKKKKEELLRLSLKNSNIAVIFVGVLFVVSCGFGIKFILSSQTIFYILTSATIIILSVLLPFMKLVIIRIKIIKKILKNL